MLRIIAERDSRMRWRAWWQDLPSEYEEADSALEAVANLIATYGRGASMSDLVNDPKAFRPWHVEMTVSNESGKSG